MITDTRQPTESQDDRHSRIVRRQPATAANLKSMLGSPVRGSAETRLLLQVLQSIAISTRGEEVLRRTLDLAQALFDTPAAAIATMAPGGGLETVVLCTSRDLRHRTLTRPQEEPGLLSHTTNISSARRYPTASSFPAPLEPFFNEVPATSAIAAPIFLDGVCRGSILLLRTDGRRFFADDELALEKLAAVAAIGFGHLRGVHLERSRTDRAENRSQEQADFLSMVSHDVKGPLAVVYGFAETLAARGDAVPEQERARMLHLISDHAMKIDRLVTGLLDAARIEAGALDMHRETVDAAALVRAVVQLLDAEEQRVVVRAPEQVEADVDPTRIEQLVQNLVSNARKYGRGPVEVDLTADDHTLELRVRDHGDGIQGPSREHLFERFAPGAGHIGLGLSIVRGIAEAHGGTVRYEDAEPHGACFVVRLPRFGADAGR